MAKKAFLSGMLALALVFGLTIVGCEVEEEEESPTPSRVDGTVTVTGIPAEKNGQPVTMVLFLPSTYSYLGPNGWDRDEQSRTGTVAAGMTTINFVFETSAPNFSHRSISLKIGDDPVKLAKWDPDDSHLIQIDFERNSIGIWTGTHTLDYSRFSY